MRRLIVRFRNQEDLDKINLKIGMTLESSTKQVYLPDKKEIRKEREIKIKKIEPYWKSEWFDMPEFETNSNYQYVKIEFYVDETYTTEKLSELFEQNITTQTKSLWYPRLIHGLNKNIRVIGGDNPKYPIYVVSKGRYNLGRMATSFRLSEMNVPHFLVVEPDEYDAYVSNFKNDYCSVIKMDLSYKEKYDVFDSFGLSKSCGPGAVRNFCWDDSIKRGFKWHWVMDDNLDGFHRFWKSRRIISMTGATFSTLEKFVDRYENIGMAGLNYTNFCLDGEDRPAFVLNTRIYSCNLIRNDTPYRWRGRYNEDTDLSLRMLKDGWCTVQLNLFLAGKRCTQQLKGGNTQEFYSHEGTLPKSQMLVDMHPDVSELVWKFSRWHHKVDYSGFKQKLKLKDGVDKNYSVNNLNIKMIRVPWSDMNEEIDNREYLENNYFKNEIYDI